MKKNLLFLFVLFYITACSQQDPFLADQGSKLLAQSNWDADAGVIPSLTIGSKITSSSNPKMANKVLDEKKETHWQSGAPFPTNFISRKDQNILIGHFLKKSNYNSSNISSPQNATDGDANATNSIVSVINGNAFVEIIFKQPQNLNTIALKAGGVKQPIEIFIILFLFKSFIL